LVFFFDNPENNLAITFLYLQCAAVVLINTTYRTFLLSNKLD